MGSHAKAQDIVLVLQILFFWCVTFVAVGIYFPPALWIRHCILQTLKECDYCSSRQSKGSLLNFFFFTFYNQNILRISEV